MDYVFGRMVLGFLGLVSIGLIVVGVILAVGGLGVGTGLTARGGFPVAAPTGLMGAVPGIAIALVGVVLLAMVEHFTANFDTASNSKKLVQIAEEQLRVSRQALKVGALVVPGYADMEINERERLIGNGQSTRSGFLGRFAKGKEDPDEPIAPYRLRHRSDWPEALPDDDTAPQLDNFTRGGRLATSRIEPRLSRDTLPSSPSSADT